jgi:hypothetical protein
MDNPGTKAAQNRRTPKRFAILDALLELSKVLECGGSALL